MSGGVKKSEARDAEHHLLRMTTTLPQKEVFTNREFFRQQILTSYV